jgi:tetratricopeptide (TPR) repeat protein
MGHYPEALKAYQRTFDSAEKTGFIGAQAYGLIGQASIRVLAGELTLAQSDLDRAAAIMQGKIPESSSVQLRRVFTQAQLDAAQNREDKALAGLTKIVDLSSSNNSPGNAAAVSAYRLRAEIEMRQGKGDLALSDARKAVQVAESLQGANRFSGDTGLAYLTLGGVLLKTTERSNAPAALRSAVDHLSNSLGHEHPDTQHAEQLLAQT